MGAPIFDSTRGDESIIFTNIIHIFIEKFFPKGTRLEVSRDRISQPGIQAGSGISHSQIQKILSRIRKNRKQILFN